MSDFEYLGPYKVGRVLGRGGMGTVYEAAHAKTGDVFAVKLIAQHVAEDSRFRRRFNAEVETLKRLRHPGIVQLVGYGEEAGSLFYSMELVTGQTLQQRIREVKRLGWLPAVDIAIQICAALKHAHDIGVIHRDLKPANLLLTDSGDVKLVDFGIAKLFGSSEHTAAGSVLGTADYMAPEQADGAGITVRTDLYALGSVMYAMMAGRSPFAGKKLTQVIESLKRDKAVPLDLINPEIPVEVVEIVHHLLEKDPTDRPPTALSVMNRLKATRAGLKRGKTVLLEDGATKIDTPEDHVFPSTSEGPEADTQASHLTDASAIISPNDPTNATGQGRVTGRSVRENAKDKNALAGRSNSQAPATSVTGGSEIQTSAESLDFSTAESTRVTETRFQAIEDEPTREAFFGAAAPTDESGGAWWQWLSVAGMLAVLIIGIGLIVRTVQTPSADELHSKLEQAADEGELTLQTTVMQRFLKNYADDPRADQVRSWQDQSEVESKLRRLSAKARSLGGITRLPPAQQAFLQCMKLRDTSSEEAEKRLQAWLDVYDEEVSIANDPSGNETELAEILPAILQDRERRRLSALVRSELDRLRAMEVPTLAEDTRLVSLRHRLVASKEFDSVRRDALLKGIIELHQNDLWAQPIVDEVRKELSDQP